MTRTDLERELAGLQQQEREHRILAERAAGAIQALQHVLAKMPADPVYSNLEPFPGKGTVTSVTDRDLAPNRLRPVDVDSLGEPAPV